VGAVGWGSGVVDAGLWFWRVSWIRRGGVADALVDPEGVLEVRGGLAGVAVSQVGLAESLQGACFL